ncbi:MAG TPA: hypothetical protein VGC67_03395 [Cellulomonas sp.]
MRAAATPPRASDRGASQPGGAAVHPSAPGRRRWWWVLDGAGSVALLILAGALGYSVRGKLGMLGALVACVVLLGVVRMLLTMYGADELIRRRRAHH